jgi:hypothetical protein
LPSQKLGQHAYQTRTQQFLHGFIANHVLPHHKRENIRAIVIMGDATPTASTQLGTAALDAVGNEEAKLMTDIAPSEVAAYGAAVLARMTEERPEDFATYDGNLLIPDEQWEAEQARKAQLEDEHSEL